MSDEQAVALAEAALRRGDLLQAFDLSSSALDAGATAPRFAFQKVLALARMGDSQAALAEAERYRLADRLDEDSAALCARILKDIAFAAPAAERRPLFERARLAYLDVYRRSGGYFSGINAASLALLAGHPAEAARLAEAILAHPEVVAPVHYFAAASAAEALLLLGRNDAAAAMLVDALALPGADMAARASTIRQFDALGVALGRIAAVTAVTRAAQLPPVICFTGHIFAADDPEEPALAARIAAALDTTGAMIGYGALAAGADILVGEALLARGAELNVILPFERAAFVAQSVLPAGASWLPRFDALLARATSVTYAMDGPYVGDPNQFQYGNEIAMGSAALRASHLATKALLLAVWNAASAGGAGGTAEVVADWQAGGRPVHIIPPGPIDGQSHRRAVPVTVPPPHDRTRRSLIFTDYAGFSRLREDAMPIFWREVMGRVGAVLDEQGDAILFRNSWGDALYAVVAEPGIAAEVALRLQERLAEVDPAALGLPPGGGMRIAIHHGPLYRAHDPITGRLGYFGTEVTRTARIEPITPIGDVYATAPFAAMLALGTERRFDARYVGHVPLAKQFGSMAMYRLVRRF